MATQYDWWGYAKGMIRRYPKLVAEYNDLHDTPITAQITGLPHSSRVAKPVEDAAMRTMPGVHMRELEAVEHAIKDTMAKKDGAERLKIIRLEFWDRTHTLSGAATEAHVSYDTAKNWHREFIRRVAQNFGLL